MFMVFDIIGLALVM